VLSRRQFSIATGASLFSAQSFGASSSRRLALLFASPWEESPLHAGDLALMQEGLRGRGLGDGEIESAMATFDRDGLLKLIERVSERIAAWSSGELLIYYDGKGMYASQTDTRAEPGLQLNSHRDQTSSFILWREMFDALKAPTRVRVTLLPDCCHTNLLVGRLPSNVTAIIMKSEPQDTLNCRTGTAFFQESSGRIRRSVITNYAARTMKTVRTVGEWLKAIDVTADRDVSSGRLESFRRVRLMVEGEATARLVGQATPSRSPPKPGTP
jgi:hypothetical protein